LPAAFGCNHLQQAAKDIEFQAFHDVSTNLRPRPAGMNAWRMFRSHCTRLLCNIEGVSRWMTATSSMTGLLPSSLPINQLMR
jgi:hypothetical protein